MAAETVSQPTAAPTAKLQAVGVSGAAAVLAVYVADQFGVDLPEAVAGAAVLVVSWIAGYLKRAKRTEA